LGLSVVISGAIIMVSLLAILYSMPGLMDSIISLEGTSSEISTLENSILQTTISVDTITTISGTNTVNFNLNNEGSEKLWNYDKFELFITYDADISGVKTKITEKSSFGYPTDFKIQSGRFSVPSGAGGDTAIITEGIDFDMCTGDCFIKLVSTRHTSLGRDDTSGQNNQPLDDWMFYISDDSGLTNEGGTITFTRHGTGTTNHIFWEIWEYVGSSSSPNKITVWDTGVCTFGAGSLTCNGPAVAGFSGNDAKVVVFLTGAANPETSTNEPQRCMVTTAWNAGLDRPEFTRSESGNDCDISFTIAEFSGSNWNVERIEHTFTGANPQTEAVTDVGDRTRAFFHHQQRNSGDTSGDALEQVGAEVELTDSTTLTYRLNQGTGGWGANMISVTWIISNTEIDAGKNMIVEHLHPPERPNNQAAGTGPGQDSWSVAITPVTNQLSETAIEGMTSQSDGGGNSWPRGAINAELIDRSTVMLYQSDDGQPQEYTFQVVQFPRVPSQWKITNILNDSLDPNIINDAETAQITASLTYPIFAGGNLAVVISTDKGVTTTNSIQVT
jgi:hypothetical protein